MCSQGFPVQRAGDLAIVVLPAEIDISLADVVRYDLISVIEQGVAVLIADMSMTAFCDSAALGSLIAAHRRAVAAGAELRLVVSCAPVLRVMRLTGADQLLSVYPTLAAAQAGAASPGHAPSQPEPTG